MSESIVSKQMPAIKLNCFDLKAGMKLNIYECLDSDVSALKLLDGDDGSQNQYGIYFCVRSIACEDGAFNEIVYVGKTINLKARIIKHHKRGALKLLRIRYIYFVSFDCDLYCEKDLLCAERTYIKTISPILNDLNHSKLLLNDENYLKKSKGFGNKKKPNKKTKLELELSMTEMMMMAIEFIYFIPELFLDFLHWQTECNKWGYSDLEKEIVNPTGYALAKKHGWTGELMDVALYEEMFENCLVYADLYCNNNSFGAIGQFIDETIVFNAILKGVAMLSTKCESAYEALHDSDYYEYRQKAKSDDSKTDKIIEFAEYYASRLFNESHLLSMKFWLQSFNPNLRKSNEKTLTIAFNPKLK